VWIEEIHFENYKCFHKQQVVRLDRGLNVVVGRNNSGKSAFLEILGLKFVGAPHKSRHSVPQAGAVFNPVSSAGVRIRAHRDEIKKWMALLNQAIKLRWPSELDVDARSIPFAIDRILAPDFSTLQFSIRATENSSGLRCERYPVIDSYSCVPATNGKAVLFSITTKETRDGFVPGGVGTEAETSESGLQLAELARAGIYRFDAQRLNIHRSGFGANSELAPNAANLPEVLNDMNNNAPERFAEFVEAVRQVFPEVRNVRTPAVQSSREVQVKVWMEGTPKGRDDLGLTLDQCGTGIGQVLAILYIAVRSDEPRCIFIDEPSSFLHPDAARSLVKVLGHYSQHQYVISTHSPEIISACKLAPIIKVRWEEGRSTVNQFDASSNVRIRDALSEVGAKLSDLFGFDRIVWAEGISDARSWKFLAEREGLASERTAFLPVRDTGAFHRKELRRVIDLYRKLSMEDAWLPPAVAFLFDRDGRSQEDIADLSRESNNRMRFLDRRMLENYCLDPRGIVALLQSFDPKSAISVQDVRAWFDRNLELQSAGDHWKKTVNGGHLLSSVTSEMTNARFEFRKAQHTPWLIAWAREHQPDELSGLIELIRDVLNQKAS
jgi:predicted ATPase